MLEPQQPYQIYPEKTPKEADFYNQHVEFLCCHLIVICHRHLWTLTFLSSLSFYLSNSHCSRDNISIKKLHCFIFAIGLSNLYQSSTVQLIRRGTSDFIAAPNL